MAEPARVHQHEECAALLASFTAEGPKNGQCASCKRSNTVKQQPIKKQDHCFPGTPPTWTLATPHVWNAKAAILPTYCNTLDFNAGNVMERENTKLRERLRRR